MRYRSAEFLEGGGRGGCKIVNVKTYTNIYIKIYILRRDINLKITKTFFSSRKKNISRDSAKMEERKLIRLGNSSFAIALPKEWIRKAGLKKGDKVFIVPNSNGELIISPEFKKNGIGEKIILNVDNKNEERLRREFTSSYINGASIFSFVGKITKEKNKIIKKIIKDFISCEVAEESEQEVLVRDFFNVEETNLKNFIKRMDNNIREMFDILISCIEKNKITKTEIEEIKRIDLDTNKFYFLNSRILVLGLNNPTLLNKLKLNPTELFNEWWLTFQLEHTGDNLKTIARRLSLANIGENEKKVIFSLLVKIKNKYIESLKTFYNKDKEKAYELMEDKKIWTLCENLTKTKNGFLSLVGERLNELDNASYQIIKMVTHLED